MQGGDDTCMRAYKLLKSGFQTWVTLFNSIHYKVMPIHLLGTSKDIGRFFFF